jgi:PAS domain S-box-containing protein
MNPHPAPVAPAIRTVRLFFILTAAILASGIGASYLAGRVALEATARVRQFDTAIEAMQDLRSSVQDAETGQRGYLLTRDARRLEPSKEAMVMIQSRLETVRKMVVAGILPAEQISELESLIVRKIEELRKIVSLIQSGRPSAAMEIVRGDQGQELTDSIRRTIEEIVSDQENRRAAAIREADWAIELRGGVFLAGVTISLSFLVWAYRRIGKEMLQNFVASLEARRQKDILAVTLASIGDAVIITDLKGRITFLNEVAEKLTGWSAKGAEDRSCSEVFRIINEETGLPVESPVEKVLASGAIAGLANHTLLVRKDGSHLPIDDSSAPIRESDGTVRGVVLIFRDFTAHKDFERTLIRAKEEIEASNKAKDKFLATLSHELRTPLTPVLATLSAWEVTNQLPPNLRGDVERVRRNVELEARLIDDLLDLSRIENGKLSLEKELLDVHGAIQSAIARFRDEAYAKELQIRCRFEAKASFLEADSARLQQILSNIIGNAVKFTPEGGNIEIATANPHETELTISITDDGVGISEEVMARLFHPFEQGNLAPDRKSQGLGLGLLIAKALVEAHGGTLQVASKGPHQGSTFVISLPIADSARILASAAPVMSARSDREGLRILLIEDHEDTAQVLQNVLRQMGHKVETCSTVATACQKLQESRFDILLSDIGLPDGTGIDFIKAARQICQTPAVALTGYGMAEDVEKCLQAGFDEHLTKPIDVERLEKTLSRISPKPAIPSNERAQPEMAAEENVTN